MHRPPTQDRKKRSEPTTAVPKLAVPKPKAKATNVTPKSVDERIQAFKDRLNEAGMNDYADDESDAQLDDETLLAMVNRSEGDPEKFRFLTKETIRRIEQREEAFEKLREEELVRKGILPETGRREPVEFEDAIRAQATMHKIPIQVIPKPAAVANDDDGFVREPIINKPKSRRHDYDTDKSNLMIARDPNQDIEPDRLLGAKPRPLGPRDPYELPALPTSLLRRPELADDDRTARVLAVLQKYQIRAARKTYYESDIETFRREIEREVSDEYKVVCTNQCIVCIYLIFTPLCIYCKFSRKMQPSGADRDIPREHRLYYWEGHAFTELMSDEEEPTVKHSRTDD